MADHEADSLFEASARLQADATELCEQAAAALAAAQARRRRENRRSPSEPPVPCGQAGPGAGRCSWHPRGSRGDYSGAKSLPDHGEVPR
ncbi:hypothetical protein Acy02nite_32130 [Actinoplanes cyaneus]|uniref:Uncharacterized protein n=1 Tax=Actinoplanes cyaneus TaxID=52696 RepID=A0A919M487_9ACTN|nr:hypothetical protein [Actinoplanes cyaneus]MCW2142526.1 hypothetical protein [Actinoplanes cyaneus]GID65332.1 hypothetical protein Acy02nite_32130 [Actinoplanes cyaneus]